MPMVSPLLLQKRPNNKIVNCVSKNLQQEFFCLLFFYFFSTLFSTFVRQIFGGFALGGVNKLLENLPLCVSRMLLKAIVLLFCSVSCVSFYFQLLYNAYLPSFIFKDNRRKRIHGRDHQGGRRWAFFCCLRALEIP